MRKRITFKKFRHTITKSVLFSTLIVMFICGCGKSTTDYVESDFVKETQSQTELQQTQTQIQIQESSKEKTTEQPNKICVYICGCIQKPDVYFLEEGSRICDIFELAGGLTEEAATDYWNQAQLLTDGEMIYVPTKEEANEQGLSENSGFHSMSKEDTNGKININTATKEELMKIPGVGETRAESIVSYREEHGKFSDISDIKRVSGIKDGLFDKMKEYIVVN